MSIENMDFKTLFAIAIKSEQESEKLYRTLAEKTKNFLLKDRLMFLADEEKKHEKILKKFFDGMYPGEDVPDVNVPAVPLPEVRFDENSMVSEILENAADAEIAAKNFYKDLARKARDAGKEEISKGLLYLSMMELGHYHLIKDELEAVREFEDYDAYWEMMHSGP